MAFGCRDQTFDFGSQFRVALSDIPEYFNPLRSVCFDNGLK